MYDFIGKVVEISKEKYFTTIIAEDCCEDTLRDNRVVFKWHPNDSHCDPKIGDWVKIRFRIEHFYYKDYDGNEKGPYISLVCHRIRLLAQAETANSPSRP